MRGVDARAIADLGIPGPTLMENAGRGAAEALLSALPERGLRPRGLRVAIVCGHGGNGGDGFVVARRLKRAGARPDVLLTAPPDALRGDAALKYQELRRAGIVARLVEDAATVAPVLQRADVIVDALLGTGAHGAPAPLVAALIEAINASDRPVVALDVPSGLPADGAAPEGPVVRAWLTPTFAAAKLALVLGPGVELAGRVSIVPIGVPAPEVARDARTFVLEPADVAPLFPRRPRDVHKGTYGHLLVVAGSLGKAGAAALCVLTPHPGEMARLIGGTVDDVQRDRLGVARTFATVHGAYLVLKGARTLIAEPDGRVLINPTGNSGMASGGTGDVLTGIIGALLARGIDAAHAALAGVYLHGLAGDVAAERVGEEALIAGDVIEALGEAFRRLADER